MTMFQLSYIVQNLLYCLIIIYITKLRFFGLKNKVPNNDKSEI